MKDINTLNSIVPGWSEIPNGMMTNPHKDGGIIDCTFVSGEWFVIFNDDRAMLDSLTTRTKAIAAFIEAHEALIEAAAMPAIECTPQDVKAGLLDRICLIDQDRMKIVAVGGSCPEDGTIYLHMASTTRFRKQKNGDYPVQYCGWFYRDHLTIEPQNSN